ncbi:unnamed protein product [Arabidopsis arenosa]|uniref:non-specific serine/threonine protein kinase n=1 Tax=Arabidopsis arenosa TaxID=38785 RepID=A0A8S1ZQ50_ARAAE|nr:unnamed protein product [Arabidopsis arenosa]
MGYLSCNGESAVAICDPYNWDPRRKPKPEKRRPPKLRIFNYDELAVATNGFSAGNFLGKGSHGRVYKAVLDDGKLLAAVKRTTITTGGNYNNNVSQVDNEIEILSRVRHRWMVNLIGYCVDHRRKTKLLVVEYMPNDWAVPLIKRGEFVAICDLKIKNRPYSAVIRKLAVMAARCVRSTAKKRPDMLEVVECLKTVRKLSQASPAWNRLRRRSEEGSENVFAVEEEKEEIHVRIVRGGSRRNRKVANVTCVDDVYERIVPEETSLSPPPPFRRRNFVLRSRSVGAKVGPDPNDDVGDKMVDTIRLLIEIERPVITTTAAMRLSKSRSVGIVRSYKTASRKRY